MTNAILKRIDNDQKKYRIKIQQSSILSLELIFVYDDKK
jgi:hypothetical protein